MRWGRRSSGTARSIAAFRRDDQFLDVIERATTAGDERDVQLVVQIPAAQQRRRTSHDAGDRQGPADELTARQSTLAWSRDRLFLHGSATGVAPAGITMECGV